MICFRQTIGDGGLWENALYLCPLNKWGICPRKVGQLADTVMAGVSYNAAYQVTVGIQCVDDLRAEQGCLSSLKSFALSSGLTFSTTRGPEYGLTLFYARSVCIMGDELILPRLSRRQALRLLGGAAGMGVLAACSPLGSPAAAPTMAPAAQK